MTIARLEREIGALADLTRAELVERWRTHCHTIRPKASVDNDLSGLSAMAKTTSWQPHTVRAVLTGLRKRGIAIMSEKSRDKDRLYRVLREARSNAPADRKSAEHNK